MRSWKREYIPIAVYLLRMWKIIMAVMMIAAMWIQRVAEGLT